MSEQPNDRSNQHYWLALRLVPRLASHVKITLVEQHGLVAAFALSTKSLTTHGLNNKQISAIRQPNWQLIHHIVAQVHAHNGQLIDYLDNDYPRLLKQITNPPIVLFVQGNRQLLNAPQIAIVGSRSASFSALEHAKSFARQLSNQQLVITSGLALGVDSAAHQGALHANGYTIAVVATGLDIVYPARNKTLAANILAKNGTIVSEYLPGTKPNPGCFPRRNRLITGMSAGTFVIEAQIKSGSLISARLALEQNREVFAMPGAINNPHSKGCHSLIKQGAILVDQVEDILSVLDIANLSGLYKQRKQTAIKKHQKNHQQDLFIDPLLSSVDYEVTSVDTVASRCKLPIEDVLTRLMTLELRGLVTAVPGGYIKLN